MQIQVNGKALELTQGATVAELVEQLALTGKRIAVEVNEDIVPRSRHGEVILNESDRVEVVHAIGGG